MKPIQVIPDIDFDVDAVTQKFAWLGRTSSGKTFACKRFVEQLLKVGAQVVVVDTMGVWFGLRQGPKGFDIPVIGGLYGDIPLEPTAGILVAEVVVSSGSSMVLDVSQMTDGQRARFMEAFGRRLFELRKEHPSAMHIVLDEAQDVVPQNVNDGEKMMLHEWVRIAKQGRALGLGLSFTSQRPQEINKKALNQTECVLAFQLTGAHERKALEYWLSDKGLDTKLSHELPKLEVGVPFVWSPQWLKVAKVMGRVLPIESADTSQTPKLGEKSRCSIELKPIDLRALRQSMSDMVAKTRETDPVVLKKRVKELEEQLLGQAPAEDTQRLEQLLAKVRQRDEQVAGALHEAVRLTEEMAGALDTLAGVSKKLGGVLENLKLTPLQLEDLPVTKAPKRKAPPAVPAEAPPRARRERTSRAPADATSNGLPSGEAAVLQAIAQYGERGVRMTTVMVMTGYKKSYVNLCIQSLRSQQLIDRPEPGLVTVNALGRDKLPKNFKPYPTGKKLLQHLIDTLPSGESNILRCVPVAPKDVEIKSLLSETGYKKSYVNLCVQSLVSRRAVRRSRPGFLQIHPEVFA